MGPETDGRAEGAPGHGLGPRGRTSVTAPRFASAAPQRSDMTMLGLRVLLGVVLALGAQSRVFSSELMQECVDAWARLNVAFPELIANVSVTAQLVCGFLITFGLLTRIAGLFTTVNFGTAAAVSNVEAAPLSLWPFVLVVLLSLHFGLRGGGLLSLDRRLRFRRAAAGPGSGRAGEPTAPFALDPFSAILSHEVEMGEEGERRYRGPDRMRRDGGAGGFED